MDITTWCSSASGLYFYTTYHWHPLNQLNNRSVDTKADGSRFQEASAALVNKTGEKTTVDVNRRQIQDQQD